MSTIASYLTIITWLDFRHFRAKGTHRGRHFEANHVKVQSTDNIAMDEELLHERRYAHTPDYRAYQSGDAYGSHSPSPWRQGE
ncbi:hypothetical protein ACHAPJ_011688 [Fusarium lateritium]